MQNISQDDSGLARIERQLERLDALTRNLATRQDLADLRKEVVQTAVLDSQLTLFKTQITQLEKRIDEMDKEQVSRSDRFWARISPAIAAAALLITLIEFLSHYHFVP